MQKEEPLISVRFPFEDRGFPPFRQAVHRPVQNNPPRIRRLSMPWLDPRCLRPATSPTLSLRARQPVSFAWAIANGSPQPEFGPSGHGRVDSSTP